MERDLSPSPNLKLRLIILGSLLLPIIFARHIGIVWQTIACFVPVCLAGTYRHSRIRDIWFETTLYVGFVPVSSQRCKLPAVVYIHTRWNQQQTGVWTLFLFGPLQFIFSHLFDFLIPVLGGGYDIDLETAKGREVRAWTGNNQAQFEANVELLRNETKAEIRLR